MEFEKQNFSKLESVGLGGDMRPSELTDIDLKVISILKKEFLTFKEIKKFYETSGQAQFAIKKISVNFPLYEERKAKGFCYKILTFEDIDKYLEGKALVY